MSRVVHAVAAAVLVVVLAGACTNSSNNQANQESTRVRTRLEESFSRDQVTCLLDALEPADVKALAATKDLDPKSKLLERYSQSLRTCVIGFQAPVTSTTAGS